MDLRQLRYFVVLAEELHFRRAAERLNITQAPLSMAIQALERELGGKLFHRTQRRVALSEIGSVFRDKAISVLDKVEQYREDIRQIVAGEAGNLRIGFTPAISLLPFFPKLIIEFRKKFPGVAVALKDLYSTDQVVALQERTIDVGFVRRPLLNHPSDVSFVKLVSDELVVAMHRTHPLRRLAALKIADLIDEPFIFYPRQSGVGIYDHLIRLCAKRSFTPKIVQEARDASTIVGLAAAGLGIAVVPSGLRCIDVPNIVFRTLADADATTDVFMIYRAGEASTLVSSFRHLTRAIATRKATATPVSK